MPSDHPAGPDLAAALLPALEQVLARLADRPRAEPLLVSARELAALLGVSAATLERMKAANKLPRAVELSGGCHRWRLAEVREWVLAGCPGRREWEARQQARARA
jgi:predicted DNA-binding transcriptional regulator AlpA